MRLVRPRPTARLAVESLEARDNPSGGTLDPTFGSGGVATVPTDTYTTQPVTAVQPDGKILTAQQVYAGGLYQPAVTRLNANGSVDTTYGTNGTVRLSVAKYAAVTALTVAPDGKLLVGCSAYTKYGFSGQSDSEYAVARLNANGTLDTTFGNSGGFWLSNPSAKDEVVYQLATVPAAGGGYSVIVGGAAGGFINQANSQMAFAAVKLTQAGLPDTAFGSGGVATRLLSTGLTAFPTTSMAVTASGEIVFAGSVGSSGAALYGTVLVGFTPAGQPDAGFGTNGVVSLYTTGTGGVVTTTFPGTIRGLGQRGLAAQGNSLIVAGAVTVSSSSSPSGVASEGFVLRYTPAGTLDTSFGTGGAFTGPADYRTGNSSFTTVAVGADGSIAVAGRSGYYDANNVNHGGLIVGHLTAGGLADPGFGTAGTGLVIRYDQDPYPSYGYLSLNIDPLTGNLLVGSVATGYPAHGYLMRFRVA